MNPKKNFKNKGLEHCSMTKYTVSMYKSLMARIIPTPPEKVFSHQK